MNTRSVSGLFMGKKPHCYWHAESGQHWIDSSLDFLDRLADLEYAYMCLGRMLKAMATSLHELSVSLCGKMMPCCGTLVWCLSLVFCQWMWFATAIKSYLWNMLLLCLIHLLYPRSHQYQQSAAQAPRDNVGTIKPMSSAYTWWHYETSGYCMCWASFRSNQALSASGVGFASKTTGFIVLGTGSQGVPFTSHQLI